MDLEIQKAIREAVEEHCQSEIVVFLGATQPESVAVSAQTVTTGDPSYAGPLAGVSLGLPVFHILEETVKNQVAADTWHKNVSIVAMIADNSALMAALGRPA